MSEHFSAAPGPFSVPVVDISAYVSPLASDAAVRARVAVDMARACRDVGFVQVRGHGIPHDVIAGLGAAIDAFFDQPLDTKQRYRTPPQINRGYAPPHSESLSLSLGVESASQLNDYFEAFNIGAAASEFSQLTLPADVYAENVWPGDGDGFAAAPFRAAVEAYFTAAGGVARTLCRVFADALNVSPQTFTSVTDHSVDVLRMIRYALPDGLAVGDVTPTGMGAHTDYGIVTVLWADPVPGLQVLGGDGVWHDVQPAPGCLLVNLGDLTARWTNDRWRSTLHRVQPPVVDGRIRRRRSAAYFHDGNYDALISTLRSCVGIDGGQYPPITVADHLAAKLAGSRAGVANTAAGEEAERVRAAETVDR
ncbi:isopenicillin N synthase family dioxygenase [Solimonas marina]|uniref:2-oxoglutarate-dependent ethylene/succinate-forming enzyme n=1 Tax=Solimonas marina TaxID=2714601 RepID=A0A970BAR6_9GAMM|nr:isopenicillin N synthase family oxygenase [Solimonas marina]NKF24759.1 isopenicillin N synthase family oxygenase [Solimonas marina]